MQAESHFWSVVFWTSLSADTTSVTSHAQTHLSNLCCDFTLWETVVNSSKELWEVRTLWSWGGLSMPHLLVMWQDHVWINCHIGGHYPVIQQHYNTTMIVPLRKNFCVGSGWSSFCHSANPQKKIWVLSFAKCIYKQSLNLTSCKRNHPKFLHWNLALINGAVSIIWEMLKVYL